jgi:hypothetical protein
MKSVLKISVVALILALLTSSCAKTFYSVDGKSIAQKHHKSVAVMPSFVSISPKGVNRKFAAEVLEKQEAIESLNFQRAIYVWMQKRKSEGKVVVEIQDIEATNVKLKNAGYPETLITDAKICEILGVDGIIVSNFELSKTIMMLGTVPAMIPFEMDEVEAVIGINDCANNKIIWSCRQKLTESDLKKVINSFMKKIGKKMPYVK